MNEAIQSTTGSNLFAETTLQRFAREVDKYPPGRQQSAVMACLTIAQEENDGWLSTEIIEAVAAYLKLQPIAVQEVATFYNMYELEPIGRHKLTVCTNLPCALSGANHAAQYLQEKLGISFNETTPDGKITLKEGECMGACGDAPVMLHNNHRMCNRMDRQAIDVLLESLQ